MTIIPNQNFKHGADNFAKGQEYDVSDEDAEYFELCGWVGERAEPTDHSLDIQDIQLGHTSEVN